MQSPDKKVKRSASTDSEKARASNQRGLEEEELSEAWRELLGIEPSDALGTLDAQVTPLTPDAQEVQPLASDPWHDLMHMKGMEQIDLQQIRSHEMAVLSEDSDVEQALHKMQEGVDKKPAEGSTQGNTN